MCRYVEATQAKAYCCKLKRRVEEEGAPIRDIILEPRPPPEDAADRPEALEGSGSSHEYYLVTIAKTDQASIREDDQEELRSADACRDIELLHVAE